MIKPVFTGKIRNQEFYMNDRKLFDKYVAGLPIGDYQLTIERRRKHRTTGKNWEKSNQNGYYWGVVIPIICETTGEECPDEMHFNIKRKFLRIGGTDDLPKLRSTKSLNTLEWEELMEKIRVWAATDLHTRIPEPLEIDMQDINKLSTKNACDTDGNRS